MMFRKASLAAMLVLGFALTAGTGCRLFQSHATVRNVSGPDFLKTLNKLDEFKALAHTDENGAQFVKFTWEFKTPAQEFVFQNTRKWFLHPEFLKAHYPQWANIDIPEYERIALKPESQEIVTGALYYSESPKIPGWTGSDAVGLTLYLYGDTVNLERIEQVYNAIQKFAPFANDKMVYLFETQKQWMFNQLNLKKTKGISSTWTTNFVNVANKATTYNAAESYGYLKKISHEEFAAGNYTNKDILIFDEVPLDIGPLSGVISETALVPNSHIIFRCVNQKIPNLFIPDAAKHPAVTAHLGKLIHLVAEKNGVFKIEPADAVAAEQYFTSRIPNLPPPRSDLANRALFRFGAGQPNKDLIVAYGAKGTNFSILNDALSKAGFNRSKFASSLLIPFSFYKRHVDQPLNTKGCNKAASKCTEDGFSCSDLATQCLAQVGKTSLNGFITSLTTPASALVADGTRRKNTLTFVRYLIAKSPLPADLEAGVIAELRARFQPTTRIRFRSSTNAEDLPGLTGAGLYASYSGCLGDIDSASSGKSACMSTFEYERKNRRLAQLRALNNPVVEPLIRDLTESLTDKDEPKDALRKVYSSLWTERAFLFRDYYRIPHEAIFMGVLVIPSFADESANGVAIVEKKDGVWESSVVVQNEEISVTNPEIPNAVAENFRSYLGAGGSLVKPTEYYAHSNQKQGAVLSDAQVLSLSQQLKVLQTTFEQLMGASYGRMDVEFKADAQGVIEIKQARPL